MKTRQFSKILNCLALPFNKRDEILINLASGQPRETLCRKYVLTHGKKNVGTRYQGYSKSINFRIFI